MNDSLKNSLIEWGMDWDDIYGRFMGNEAMIEKYIMRYPDNETFEELKKAVADGDAKAGFAAAHNLKGVCINLALNALAEPASELTELLRGGEFNRAEANRLLNTISERQESLVNIISSYKK